MINCVVQLIMSYRHPNEMKANKELLEEITQVAVSNGLNEVMPGVMEEMESVLGEKIDDLKRDLERKAEPIPAKTFTEGVWIGLGIGGCLFIGLLAGLLVGKIL